VVVSSDFQDGDREVSKVGFQVRVDALRVMVTGIDGVVCFLRLSQDAGVR
jgi:hypothetical protein